ncbi:unnamed protein product, partial [marine sediment metagenome]
MPWTEISTGTAQLTFTNTGLVEWNTALQLKMGAPTWVELMCNVADGTLGIRAVNSPSGFPIVAEPEGSEYKIDSVAALEAAGISVANTITVEPESWYQPTAPGTGPSVWFGHEPIYY